MAVSGACPRVKDGRHDGLIAVDGTSSVAGLSRLSLDACKVGPCATGHACIVDGQRAALTARLCTFIFLFSLCKLRDNQLAGLFVHAGGAAELTGCDLHGSKNSEGASVCGGGSKLVAKDCKLRDNHLAGLCVGAGGSAELAGCDLHGSRCLFEDPHGGGTRTTRTRMAGGRGPAAAVGSAQAAKVWNRPA
jgi:hypothetical protein